MVKRSFIDRLTGGAEVTESPLFRPLYQDPFEGICRHALALGSEARKHIVQNCPRCGWMTDPKAIDPDAGCLLEGMDLQPTEGQSTEGE